MKKEKMLLYWLWLISVSGVGNLRNQLLIEKYGNPKAVYDADPEDFYKSGLMPPASAALFKNKDLSEAEKILKICWEFDISVITADSPDFPEQFEFIVPKPLVLFVRGKLCLPPEKLSISVIGTRNCSQSGRALARKLSESLATLGIPIISGLALGIDAQSHIGALKAGGYTVAFLANSVDYCYPPANKEIYNAICRNGAVVSEYPPVTRPFPNNFHARNRLISGISTGTVVIETGDKGGCFITSGCAAEQGKDLFVIPQSPQSPYCKGAISLIRQGAYPIADATDIIEYYSGRYNIVLREENKPAEESGDAKAKTPHGDTPEEIILSVLGIYPKNISEITYACDIPANEAAKILTMLEIEGKVTKLAGSNYIINN